MTTPRIAITGATGALGGRIAHLLDTHDIPTRLVVRDPARVPALKHAQVAVPAM